MLVRSVSPDIVELPLIHTWNSDDTIISSIISIANNVVICGTQNGKILLFSLKDYSLSAVLLEPEMTGSNLCLDLDKSERYLFVAGSDSLVKVYDLQSDQTQCIKIIYSSVDIGDIFSISYHDSSKILFVGCQNASIIWCYIDIEILKLSNGQSDLLIDRNNLPHLRYNKFFDSTGPGGIINKIQQRKTIDFLNQISLCEIDPKDSVHFAHYGYVYCLRIFNNEFMSLKFPYDTFLVSGGGDGSVALWGIKNNKIFNLKTLENDESILSMAINQTYLYVGLANGDINVWDLLTFQMIRSFKTEDQVNSIIVINNRLIYYGNKTSLNAIDNGKIVQISNESILTLFSFQDYLVTGGSKLCRLHRLRSGSNTGSISDLTSDIIKDSYLSDDSLIENLLKLIKFKTISTYPEKYVDESRNCTKFLVKLMNRFGASTCSLLPIENGNPIIISTFKANNAAKKRLLYYGHYDVVEAGADLWKHDPFEMKNHDGYLYGRGTSDNKGPTLAMIYAIAELYNHNKLTCDFTFVIEGEEEHGSYKFRETIMKHKQLIGDIDYIFVSNSYWLDDVRPCLNYGLRGVINFTVQIESDHPDRHSGVDGGVCKEPTMDLIQLLNKLVQDGKIMIPEFYNNINHIGEEEMKFFNAIVDYDDNFKLDELIAKWTQPLLSIHKFEVSGPNTDTVIPKTVKSAVSIRVVPNQNVEEIKKNLTQYLEQEFEQIETSNHLSVSVCHEVEPWLGDLNTELYKRLFQSIKNNWGVEPLLIREGGSIPSVRFLEKTFDASTCQIPCGQSSDNAHLHDEKIRVLNLLKLRDIIKDCVGSL